MTDDNNATNTPDTETKKTRQPRTRHISTPRFVISISQERIADAVQRDSSHCMIAEAIKEAKPEYSSIDVALDSIRFTDKAKNLRYIYLTPREAQVGLINFDRGVMPKPFSFLLTRAVVVTRSSRRPKTVGPLNGMTVNQRRAIARNEQRDAEDAIAKGEPYEPSPERVAATLRALEDPNAKLGPAIAIAPALPSGNGQKSNPVIVSGKNPSTAGNLAKTRRFGVRQYLE